MHLVQIDGEPYLVTQLELVQLRTRNVIDDSAFRLAKRTRYSMWRVGVERMSDLRRNAIAAGVKDPLAR